MAWKPNRRQVGLATPHSFSKSRLSEPSMCEQLCDWFLSISDVAACCCDHKMIQTLAWVRAVHRWLVWLPEINWTIDWVERQSILNNQDDGHVKRRRGNPSLNSHNNRLLQISNTNGGRAKRQQSRKADRTPPEAATTKSGAGNHLRIQEKNLQQRRNSYFS